MEETILAAATRPVRVAIPVLVSFCADVFTVRDFTVNLSEGGIFLPTDKLCPVGTIGSLTFRFSQFDEPFQLRGQVVRQVTPEQEKDGYTSGLGIQFVDLTEQDRDRLRRLVQGVQNGSVVGAIRRGIRESKRPIELELRQRPTDQKLMLAINAQGQEITALMRESNPSVLIRLLDCPRLNNAHLCTMLRSPALPTQALRSGPRPAGPDPTSAGGTPSTGRPLKRERHALKSDRGCNTIRRSEFRPERSTIDP